MVKSQQKIGKVMVRNGVEMVGVDCFGLWTRTLTAASATIYRVEPHTYPMPEVSIASNTLWCEWIHPFMIGLPTSWLDSQPHAWIPIFVSGWTPSFMAGFTSSYL